MIRRLKFLTAGVLGFTASALLLLASPAHADLYGRGTYSNCGYQTCLTPTPVPGPTTSVSPEPSATPTPPAPVTVDTSPGGLDFAVNLSEGQVIPQGTYTVTVTPLNGQGETFAKVEIYLNGELATTVLPASTGTFYWNWATGSAAKHVIKIVTFDQDGATTTRVFNVTVQGAAAAAIPDAGGIAMIPQRIAEIAQSTAEAVSRAVKQIPVPVAQTFPYLLFALLGVGLLLLVFQARREVAEAEAMAAVVAHERALAADKDTFVQLASHYLRTPLTVIANGLDLGIGIKQIDPSPAAELKGVIDQLRTRIEQLLSASVATPVSAPEEGTAMHAKIWLRPGFFLPILLLGGLTLAFDILVIQVGNISLSLINLLTQIVLFGILALGLYMLVRGRILRRRDAEERQRIIDEQIRVDTARNQLIRDATAQLAGIVDGLAGIMPRLGDNQSSRIIRDGSTRFRQTLAKFGAAAGLQAGHSEAQWEEFRLRPLIDQAIADSAKEAQEKKVTIEAPDDVALIARHPNWLQMVITSLVDNAVTYSPTGGKVTIAVQTGDRGTIITVTDHGRGIPPSSLRKLFRPFTKSEGALTFDNEGMGFSLYLDKLIMTYIGGDIAIESTLGRGTTASIELYDRQFYQSTVQTSQPLPQAATA